MASVAPALLMDGRTGVAGGTILDWPGRPSSIEVPVMEMLLLLRLLLVAYEADDAAGGAKKSCCCCPYVTPCCLYWSV